jgi:predicted Zn-dependent protease
VKKPQWITLAAGAILTIAIFVFGRTIPHKKPVASEVHNENDGHNHSADATTSFSIDSVLIEVKQQLSPERIARLNLLENATAGKSTDTSSVRRQMDAYHRLSHFWSDTAHFLPLYAWYEAEAARLENSEKSLTFAAHLFLNYLFQDQNAGIEMTKWKALQARDLFERSLKINPDNDSSKVGLGACYIFGGISAAPMQGISLIKSVVDKDSTHIYGQMMLAKGALTSGQFDKAIDRLNTICRLQPANLEALLLLAESYERTENKAAAVKWYRESLKYVGLAEAKEAIEKRIADLSR